MLDGLLEEVEHEDEQFGSIKGSGADHLLSVDLSKAYNRMDHTVCLASLVENGASIQTLCIDENKDIKRALLYRKGYPGRSPPGHQVGDLPLLRHN